MREIDGTVEFVWWFGVVEDIGDPLKIGRCRVRVFGYHTSDKGALPTTKLPWASVVLPPTSASMGGVGVNTGLLPGSHVFGFFLDGKDAQKPVIIGSIAGIPEETANPSEGFNDPLGVFPLKSSVNGLSTVKESDINRLARNEQTDKTIVKLRKDKLDKDFPIAFSDTKSEPESPYDAKYGLNQVRATVSGHVEEWDDTPKKERILQYHNSGTFTEIGNGWKDDPKGTRVLRVVGNNYEVIHEDNTVHIRGACNVTIDGEARILCLDKSYLQLEDDAEMSINGNVKANISEKMTMKVGGDFNLKVGGEYNVTASGVNLHTTGGGRVNIAGKMVGLNSFSIGSSPSEVTLEKPDVQRQNLDTPSGGGINGVEYSPDIPAQISTSSLEDIGQGLSEAYEDLKDPSDEARQTLVQRALNKAAAAKDTVSKVDPRIKTAIGVAAAASIADLTTRSTSSDSNAQYGSIGQIPTDNSAV